MKKVEISHRIEEYFSSLGWTKVKFARAIREYPQHLNKVFEGKLDPFKYIDGLAKIGCDINWLLLGGELTQDTSGEVIKLKSDLGVIRESLKLKDEIIELYKKNNENLEVKCDVFDKELNRLNKLIRGFKKDCANKEDCPLMKAKIGNRFFGN